MITTLNKGILVQNEHEVTGFIPYSSIKYITKGKYLNIYILGETEAHSYEVKELDKLFDSLITRLNR
jgi:hypothetical protein